MESLTNTKYNNNKNNYGFQYAYGISDKKNFRFRIEKVNWLDTDDDYDFSGLHISSGIKYSLKKNKSSIYLPFSLTYSEDEESSRRIFFEPTYFYTFSTNECCELTFATNFFIPIYDSINTVNDMKIGFIPSIGIGFSSNPSKWMLRFEFDGFMFSQPTIGLSIYK
jgi:hypothetical protein